MREKFLRYYAPRALGSQRVRVAVRTQQAYHERLELGRPIFGQYLGTWRPKEVSLFTKVARWAWMLGFLFAMFGCFSALFVLGLCCSIVVVGKCLDQTWRDRLDWIPPSILIIGFAVGHWWQGRVADCAGLSAIFVGFLWLTETSFF